MADAAFSLLDDLTTGLVPSTVGIEEFAESSEYCNQALFPRQTVLLKLIFLEDMTGPEEDILSEWIESSQSGGEVTISPDIRERRDYLRGRGYKHFREIQLVGGRRSSKGFVTAIAMAKSMWDCLQLGDPHDRYGIAKGREIFFSCVAASESQAKEFQFGDFISTVEGCKAFRPYLKKSLETEFRVATPTDLRRMSADKSRQGTIDRDTSKLRGKALAANAGTLRGSATMCIAIDEMAHMTVGESKASAKEVYGAAIPSLSQFGIDGMIFVNSSPYTKVGKFYEVFEVGMKPFDATADLSLATQFSSEMVNGDPRMFSLEYPSWELFRDYMNHKSRWKQRTRGRELGKVPTTSPDWDPNEVDEQGRPMHSEEDKQFIISQRITEATDPEVFKVEQRGQFAEVIDAFLNPTLVDQMYAGVPAGLEPEIDGTYKKLYTPIFTNFGQGALNQYRYKFHCDPSSTTAGFGFAIGHNEHFVNPQSGDTEEHVVFDMIKRWDPKQFGGVIRWKPILDDILLLADIFRPYEITMDQHQCLAADTLITTSWGLLPIGQLGQGLEIGESRKIDLPVLAQDSWLYPNGKSAKAIYRRGPSKTKRLTVRGGYQIEGTDDHRLWVRKAKAKPWHPYPDPRWVHMRDIGVGDQLLVKPGMLRGGEKFVHQAHFERHRNCTIKQLPTVCDEDLAAYLGWMVSEGCIPYEPTTRMGSFTNACSEAWEDFTRLSQTLFGHTPKRYLKTDTTTDQANVPRSINRFLHNLGASGPSHLKRIPDPIMCSPDFVIRAFLRTLYEGDGSVAIRKENDQEIIYTTESPQLAKEVQQLLLTLGMHSTLYTDPHNPEIREHPCVRVRLYGQNLITFVDTVGFVSTRKTTQAAKAREQASKATNVRNNLSLEKDGSLWMSVINIEESEADCYDLTVPGPESFVANGIISHNSMEPIQTLQEMLSKRNIVCQVYMKTATNENNWKRWQVLKTAIYQGLVHAPSDEANWNTPTSQNELKFLQEMPTGGKFPKVEKQDIGPVRTKDQADCIAEVVHSLIGNLMATRMRERLSTAGSFGAPGGYGIGQGGPAMGGAGPPGISEYYASREQKVMRGQVDRASFTMDRANLTRSAIGGRGSHRGSRSRGR